jgi:hypothetical protein
MGWSNVSNFNGESRMSKVFIVNKGGHNYSSAEEFGELVYLTDGLFNRFAVSNIYRHLSEGLKDSNSDDYILISGLSIMSSIACSIFAVLHGKLNLLLYKSDRKNNRELYIKRVLIIKKEHIT